MAATQAQMQQLKQTEETLSEELEAAKASNKDLLQKTALLGSLSAEAEALRHQVNILGEGFSCSLKKILSKCRILQPRLKQ